MLIEIKGDVLKDPPLGEIIGIPVNTVGVAGKGMARYMKLAYPTSYKRYMRACRNGSISKGPLLVTCEKERWIAALPTKYSWRQDSDLSLIDDTLHRLRVYMEDNSIYTAHISHIGCGLNTGRLSYEKDVRPLIAKHFEDHWLTIKVYAK